MPLKITGILQFWCGVFYRSQLHQVAWLYFSELVFYQFLCTCMHVRAQLLVCVQGWNPSPLFPLHWQADALHWATWGAIWYTYSIGYRERSVHPTAVSLSSPALPLAFQLWQPLLALIDQFLSVLFLALLLEDICLALEAGSRHLTGICFSSCPTFSLSHGPPEHSVKIHGKELVSKEDLSVDEVARISDYYTCPLRTMATVLKVFVHSPKPHPWWSFPL